MHEKLQHPTFFYLKILLNIIIKFIIFFLEFQVEERDIWVEIQLEKFFDINKRKKVEKIWIQNWIDRRKI